jgi:hypothetical protein
MSKEQPSSKSENYGFSEEWEAMGDLGGLVGEAWLLPEALSGVILGDLLKVFSDD